jgi:serine/threonine-protein kinase
VDGFQIWAKRVDRPEQDVLAINDEAARAIADALTLDGEALEEHARDAPSNPVALDLYIRARHAFRQFQHESLARSIELFERALALSPGDPMVLSGLSRSLTRMTYYTADEKALARARELAELAVAASPQLGEAHHAHGVALFMSGDLPSAARAMRTAVTRSPGNSDAHVVLGHILSEAGAGDEAVRHFEAALAYDPGLSFALCTLGELQALLGRWDEADAIFMRVEKTSTVASWMAAHVALWRRQGDLVIHYLGDKGASERKGTQERLLLESVRTRELAPELRDIDAVIRDAGGARRKVFLLQLRAEISGYLDDREQVIASLRAGVDLGLVERLWFERCPLLDDARQDPRFAAIQATVTQRATAVLAAYRSA